MSKVKCYEKIMSICSVVFQLSFGKKPSVYVETL